MKQSIFYATLAIVTTAYINDALAVTYPYTTTTTATTATDSSKTTTTPTTKKTVTPSTTTSNPTTAAKPAKKTATKPAKAVAKPAAAPPPPKEESFFSNLSYSIMFISQSVDVTNTIGSTSTTGSEKGSGIGISAEKFYKNRYRFNGTFNYVSYDHFAITSLTAAADYLMPVSSTLAVFGGVAAGAAGQKYSDSSFSDMSLAPVYGAQLGGIMFVSDSLMLELGYRLRLTNLETEITTIPASIDTVDQLNETYLSLILSF